MDRAIFELFTGRSYEEVKDEGVKEEGHKRQLAYLRDVLKFRFGADPNETTALLRDRSLEELDELTEFLRGCASYEEFRERL
ncbi:MAG: hypothetical protein IJM30_09945 [Thermoguttaceae bacterium]|nr:hypothetical protein [Thermoguttaceae bacterium]